MTDRTLDSAAFFTITRLSSPSAPQFLLPFYGSFTPFLPTPGSFPYLPPSFTHQRCFSLSLHPLLPPHLARARSDRPPGRLPRLPASIARLRFPPLLFSPRISSREPVSVFPSPVPPPMPSSTFTIRSLSASGFSRPEVPYSL